MKPLEQLVNLQTLSCSLTQITDLKGLENLVNLQELDCSNTQIIDLKGLEQLINLQSLDCSSTSVADLSILKSLIEKKILVIWDTSDFWFDFGIFVKDCPLDRSLIAAIKLGNDAVLKYLNKPKERLWEARVLVLGEPRAGKTTLRRKLKSPNAAMPTNKESTKGIEIEVETYKCTLPLDSGRQKMQYYLWDFGGQDYYRLLHQLFVSEQAVYVIVTDTDRNKNEEEIDFWLETIQRLGKDKNGKYGPVILLQNPKTDREGSSFPDLKKRYQELWRQNEDFVINLDKIASNKSGFDKSELSRFKHFKGFLEKSFHQLDHLGQEMPRQWVRIRKALAKLTTEHYGISRDHFRAVCEKENIKNHNEQNDLLKIFHILGFLLHYDTGSLSNMVILNKEWATDALYRVLDDEIVKTNKGWFLKNDASQIWNDLKYKDRENELLQLMQEFKLSYYNEASGKYIVPSKLPEDTEGLPEWDTTGNVRLHLRYDWLPRPIATQLIVLLHDHITQLDDQQQWIWRKGAVLDGKKLDYEDAQARIMDNWRERQIEIHAQGKNSEQLIRIIMHQWRVIHEPYEGKVEVSKIILCNCKDCAKAPKPFEFEYEQVLGALKKEKPLRCNNSLDDFHAKDILKGVFDDATVMIDTLAKGERSELIKLIAKGEIKEAINRLPIDPMTLLIKTRYNGLVKNEMRGVVSIENSRIEQSQILAAVLDYLNEDYHTRGGLHHSIPKGDFSLMDQEHLAQKQKSEVVINIHGGQVNFGNRIDKIQYKPKFGLSKPDFNTLQQQIQQLTELQQATIKALIEEVPEAQTAVEKKSIGDKIIGFMNDSSIPVIQNLAASVYYDMMKMFLGI